MEIIKAENLCKSFGTGDNITNVLKNVDITIEKGQFVSIMGPSGCGKSTLLYLLGGLDEPTSGNISILGQDINRIKDKEKSQLRRKEMGFIFQFYNLVQNLTVEENILLPIVMDGMKVDKYKNKIDEILQIVGLSNKRKSFPSQLSGGQQQRVAIARAIIYEPSIIFADEQTGNLDSESSKTVMELFKEINNRLNITIVQVTHDEDTALYGNRLIRMLDGQIIEDNLNIVVGN